MQALIKQATASMKQVVHYLCYVLGLSTRLSLASGRSFIVMYHGVDAESDRLGNFAQQLAYLHKHFEIVSLEHLLARIQHPGHKGKIPIAITFDDGLKNNFTNALPLLLKRHIPATFFVCPTLIESGAWLWNIEARLRLRSLTDAELQPLLSKNGIPAASVEDAIDWMKRQPLPHRRLIEQRIREGTPSFVPTEQQHDKHDLMDWSDIGALPEFITIGSHTNSHPILTTLDAKDLFEEIVGSKNLLESKLQQPCDFFAYPNGSNNAAVVLEVSKHYKAALCAHEGYIAPDDDPYQLKRIVIEPDTGMPQFAWQLHRADH